MESLGGTFVGDITVAAGRNGALNLFGVKEDHVLYSQAQVGPNAGFRGGWMPLSDHYTGDFFFSEPSLFDPLATRVSAILHPRAAGLHIFARTFRGRIVRSVQLADGGFLPWNSLGSDGDPSVGNPVADIDEDGRAHVYLLGTSSNIFVRIHRRPVDPDAHDWDTWAPPTSVPGVMFSGDPAVRMRSFDHGSIFHGAFQMIHARGVDGRLWGKSFEVFPGAGNGRSMDWTRLDAGNRVGSAIAGQICIDPGEDGGGRPGGRFTPGGSPNRPRALLWRGVDGQLWAMFPTGYGDLAFYPQPTPLFPALSDEFGLASDPVAVATKPPAGSSEPEMIHLFWVSRIGRIMHQVRPLGEAYGPPSAVLDPATGDPFDDVLGTPAVASSENGRAELFFRRGDGALWHMWQMTRTGPLV